MVLYLTLYCNKSYFYISTLKDIGRITLLATLGTVVEILGLLFTGSYSLFILLVNILEIPLMFWGIFGKKRCPFFRLIITGYFFLIVINGVVESLWNWFGEDASFVLLLVFACGMTIITVRIWQNYRRMQKGIFPVELSHEGKRSQICGFYDSGNQLVDPYTGKGVHIISAELAKALGMTERDDVEISPVYIPYHALGNNDGIIEVYYVDELIIEGEVQRITRQQCPLGVAKENLFEGKAYKMILNEEVF